VNLAETYSGPVSFDRRHVLCWKKDVAEEEKPQLTFC